jgi:hypothetical protein
LSYIEEFGIQKQNGEDIDLNVCSPNEGSEDSLVSLDALDPDCSFENPDFKLSISLLFS